LLRPASPGTGIIAGKTVRAVLESAGIKDILSKSLGSKNAANVVKATLKGLLSLRLREEIYKGRGLEIKSENARTAVGDTGLRLNILCDYNLKPRPGAKHRRKRLGQGESSGHGKTSGRGGKGQTARSGSSIRIGFEGGQMPLIRRIPKRGFNNARFTTEVYGVNVGDLEKFDDGAAVDETALRSVGLANGARTASKFLATAN
jgi:large subunit ribosomal protein L15